MYPHVPATNFELFSSSPKDLSVYVSDRFPTRDWTLVGQFTARDERDVQSFVLEPRLFGKYIKVELQSHYGSEHFCPISLFRAYGTSEFEVLETETESDTQTDNRRAELASGGDTNDDGSAEGEDAEDVAYVDEEQSASVSSNPLFAALRLLRKGAEILIRSTDFRPTVNNITKIQESISGDVLQDASLNDCGTPMYDIACRGCDDKRFGRVFQLISCKRHYLESLISLPFIRETLAKSRLCESDSGTDVLYVNEACVDETKIRKIKDSAKYYFRARFLSSVFTPDYIIALCNILAAREQRLFANTSHQEPQLTDYTPNRTRSEQTVPVPVASSPGKVDREVVKPTSTATEPPTSSGDKLTDSGLLKSKLDSLPTGSINLSESLVTQIKPTKTTLTTEEAKVPSFVPNLESSMNQVLEDSSVHKIETPPTTEPSEPVTTKSSSTLKSREESQESVSSQRREVPSLSSAASSSKVAPSSTDRSKSSSEKTDTGSKTESKHDETEVKQKVEPEKVKEKVDPEPAKPVSPEQVNFEGFDLKDLEVEGAQSNGNANKNDALTGQQSTANVGTPQQKESVFQRLSNRIKTLERNMSLSSQYLEELSRRYKKQVEEMQRSLERAMTAMNEESRKGEERHTKRLEEVATLRGEITVLTKLLDELISERNSWWRIFDISALTQHGLFVLVEVVLVILIISYCRRVDDDADYVDEKDEGRAVRTLNRQGKTYEIIKQKCNQLTRKTKKRRPSEIASQVKGTYDQLMIENTASASKNSKKKKRKKDLAVLRTASVKETSSGSRANLNVPLHSRSASASDAISSMENNRRKDVLANLELERQDRPESAPDNIIKYFDESQQQQSLVHKKVKILAIHEGDDVSMKSTESRSLKDSNATSTLEEGAVKPESSMYSSLRKKLSSPSFMKTALGTRNKRMALTGSSSGKKVSLSLDENAIKPLERRSDEKKDSLSVLEITNGAMDDSVRTTNGLMEESDESRSSCATPTNKKKRTSGIKRMKRQPTS
ncbi:SUN domain-containing ossification factor [Copidosoma floridanum]|uniref:SUN domain-containing ossification factor n=1 Tax=Copidosoma floridanum TaxID=29053 RepID=UPI0006C9C186|nr:SUN domain-containing ossification factor [Copidosoma floridanum]